MRRILVILIAATAIISLNRNLKADVITSWTFETSVPATAGPHAAEVGTGSALGFHGAASTYSNPAGNGSVESFSSTAWSVGDYYQFSTSTVGFQNIQVTWDQTSSGTGPRDFQLAYSIGGGAFTNFGSGYAVLANAAPNPVWNTTTANPIYTFNSDLSSISALNNAADVSFRLVNTSTVSAGGGTVAATGTGRVDNFIVSNISAVPEPASWMLMSIVGLIGIVGYQVRGRNSKVCRVRVG